jgi:tricorn protease
MRQPAISPDGSMIAFTYRGRIYTVPTTGGVATAMTDAQFRSTDPIWSPDGGTIAFSAAVFNAGDVYTVPLDGGEIRRLTFNQLMDLPLAYTPDGSGIVIHTAGIGPMDANFFDGLQLLGLGRTSVVPAAGGRERAFMPVPTTQAAVSPDGNLVAYAFVRSPEVTQRKGQISDSTTDIWIYDRTTNLHRQLTHHRSNERSPVFSPDGQYVYFTAEMPANGETDVDATPQSTNVWRIPADGTGAPAQITTHDTLPVRDLSISGDGTLTYSFDGEIWTVVPGAEAQKVAITIAQGTLAAGLIPRSVNDQVTEITVSPDGTEIALVARGDVYVVDTATGMTRRITATPQAERSIGFASDGRRLLYASDRDIDWDLFESRIVRAGDAGFVYAAEIAETVLLDTDSDLLQPLYSPQGDKVAYRDGRNAIAMLDIASGAVTELLPDSATYSYEEGDLSHAWSPDGRYITTMTGFSVGNSEVAVIDIATAERHNVSLNGFADHLPQFSPDGTMVYWQTDRFSMRQLDDQTATGDIVGAYLSREAAAAVAMGKPPEAGEPDFVGMPDRAMRMTGVTQMILFSNLLPDGTLTVVSDMPGAGLAITSVDPQSGASRLLAEAPSTGDNAFAMSADGSTLFISGGGQITAYDLATGAATPIPFDTTAPRDDRAEMAYIFDHQWRFVQAKFYDAGMHGIDWPAMRDLYAKHVPHISHWEDFADLMAEMQGELNSSHMFSNFASGEDWWDEVGTLGLYWDESWDGEGMKIAGILPGGPADVPGSLLVPGAVVLAVDGVTVAPSADIDILLNHTAGREVRLGVLSPDATETVEQVVVPAPLGVESELAYNRWIAQRRAIVEDLSGGRLGYVHVAAMNNPEMQKTYSELMGRYAGAEGAVVDVRFNVGGFLHDQLIDFLTGTRHSGLFTREGVDLGLSPYDRWARPTALVQNAFSYSDGSIFPFYYRREALGPSVGDRVPGTGTAVTTVPQIEPRMTLSVAQLGFRTMEGQFFENTEIPPDQLIPTDPNFVTEGRDPQLEAAIAALLAVMDAE